MQSCLIKMWIKDSIYTCIRLEQPMFLIPALIRAGVKRFLRSCLLSIATHRLTTNGLKNVQSAVGQFFATFVKKYKDKRVNRDLDRLLVLEDDWSRDQLLMPPKQVKAPLQWLSKRRKKSFGLWKFHRKNFQKKITKVKISFLEFKNLPVKKLQLSGSKEWKAIISSYAKNCKIDS